jgi:hypothetical protein
MRGKRETDRNIVVIKMKQNDKLRGIEIRFYLVCHDLVNLTRPITIQNIFAYFEFLEAIDFTKSLNYDILKTLAKTIYTEQTNIQPNKIELCNFCYTHKVKLSAIQKYIKIPKTVYDATISQIQNEIFYQPTHLQDHIYPEIEKFLEMVKKISNLGVTIDAKILK